MRDDGANSIFIWCWVKTAEKSEQQKQERHRKWINQNAPTMFALIFAFENEIDQSETAAKQLFCFAYIVFRLSAKTERKTFTRNWANWMLDSVYSPHSTAREEGNLLFDWDAQGTQQLNQAPRSIESFNPYNWQRLNRAWWMGGFCSIFASVNGRAGSNDQLLPWRSVVVCYNEPSDLPQSHNNCVVVLMWMTCNLVNTKWASHRMICVRTICSKIIVRFFLPAVYLVRVLVARTANAK